MDNFPKYLLENYFVVFTLTEEMINILSIHLLRF